MPRDRLSLNVEVGGFQRQSTLLVRACLFATVWVWVRVCVWGGGVEGGDCFLCDYWVGLPSRRERLNSQHWS